MNNETHNTHLAALELRLSHERDRLARAKNDKERELRKVWISQIEKEIFGETRDFGVTIEISDDELLAELKT